MDDVVIHSCCWEVHLTTERQVLAKFAQEDLTVNLAECEIRQAQVTFLGYTVGSGMVKPLSAKVQAVIATNNYEGTYVVPWLGRVLSPVLLQLLRDQCATN